MKKEEIILEGTPSHVVNLMFYIQWLLIFPLLGSIFPVLGFLLFTVGFILSVIKAIKLAYTKFEITTERVIQQSGIFSRRTDEVELYRVNDIVLKEPFIQRIFGVSTLLLATNDTTDPVIEVLGIKNGTELRKTIRETIEQRRDKKRVVQAEIY